MLPISSGIRNPRSSKRQKDPCHHPEGFCRDLTGREIQPERRLGSEMSDYAKKCGVGGIFHTDELPCLWRDGRRSHRCCVAIMHAGEQDCVILVSGSNEKQAACAINQVVLRAQMALSDNPVPEETRKMLERRSTAYMRPLPGAARMYPETDVLPVLIGRGTWNAVIIPELLTHKARAVSQRIMASTGIMRLQLAGVR
jgi:glutamyl-tRNA(Gln) amidotransferase subunit E